jgi:hypothetical protein
MATSVSDAAQKPGPAAGAPFPKMMSLAEVKDILNVGMPTIYGLLRSGELRGVQIGACGASATTTSRTILSAPTKRPRNASPPEPSRLKPSKARTKAMVIALLLVPGDRIAG